MEKQIRERKRGRYNKQMRSEVKLNCENLGRLLYLFCLFLVFAVVAAPTTVIVALRDDEAFMSVSARRARCNMKKKNYDKRVIYGPPLWRRRGWNARRPLLCQPAKTWSFHSDLGLSFSRYLTPLPVSTSLNKQNKLGGTAEERSPERARMETSTKYYNGREMIKRANRNRSRTLLLGDLGVDGAQ